MYEEDKRTYNHMDDDLSEKQKENPDQIRSDSHDAQNQQEQRKQEQWTQGPRMQDYRYAGTTIHRNTGERRTAVWPRRLPLLQLPPYSLELCRPAS